MVDLSGDGRRIFKHLVIEDHYDVGYYPPNFFDYIFDIGAHIGIFSMMMRMRHPKSKIIAVEPARQQLESLKQNLHYYGIEIIEKALADGKPKYFMRRELAGSTTFIDEPIDENSYEVESISLPQLLNIYNVKSDDRYLLKFDCEGGERFLLNNEEIADIMKNAKHIAMEIHFKAPKNEHDYFLPFAVYKEWVDNNFVDTHYIKYHISSKHVGYGHYILQKRIVNYHAP